MATTFKAQIDAFIAKTKEKVEAVFKESAQEIFSIAQTPKAQGGNMPVDTSFLRNTFQSSLNGSTALSGPDAYVAIIAGAALGDTIFGGWTAEYALSQEYGTENMGGNFYAAKAYAQWQATVERNAARVAAQ